jgi:flagellar biosynthesis component FlhA
VRDTAVILSRVSLGLVPALLAASPAAAHLGHVGEVAGHAHWLAVAALAGAAAIAAWLIKSGEREDEAEETEDEEAEAEAEAEAEESRA